MTHRFALLICAALPLALPGAAFAQTPPNGSGDEPGTGTSSAQSDGGYTGDDDTAPATPPAHTTTTTHTAASDSPPPSTTTTHYGGTTAAPAGGMSSAEAAAQLAHRDERPNHLIYIEVTGGGHWLDMYAVSHSANFLPPMTVHTSDLGFGAGVAAGIRPVAFFGIGARGTLGLFPQYNFGTAAIELDLRLPTKVIEPYVRVGFGYAWVGSANYNDPSMSGTTIYGFAVTASLGLDVYLSESFSLGAAFDFDALNLARQPPNTTTVAHFATVDLAHEGNAVGLHIGGHVALGLHFL